MNKGGYALSKTKNLQERIMKTINVNEYIETAKERWIEYADYQARITNSHDEGEEIVSAVLGAVKQKDQNRLTGLVNEKLGSYTGLDHLVLNLIKAYSNDGPDRGRKEESVRFMLTDYEDLLKQMIKETTEKTLSELGLKGYPHQSGRVYRQQMIQIIGLRRYTEAVEKGWLIVDKHNHNAVNSKVFARIEDWDRFLKLHTLRGW